MSAAMLEAGSLRDRVRIEQYAADEDFDGAGSGAWSLLAEVWADVQDVLPSRGERLADGINLSTRPARVRMRRRDDVTDSMRFVMGATVVDDEVDYSSARIMQIVAGPAIIGRLRDGLEFMVEEYRPAGHGA